MPVSHSLDRRAKLLAAKLTRQKQLLVDALMPRGQRPPFTTQLSQAEALAWWRTHRFDTVGAKLIANMTQESVLELDQALVQAADEGGEGWPTTESP